MIKIYIVLSLSIFLYCSGCTSNVAGTISETDTGCAIAGIIYDNEGKTVSEAVVILHDQRNVLPSFPAKRLAGKSLQRSDTTATDRNGFFLFDSVDTGYFLIEVNHSDTFGSIIPVTVEYSDTLIEKQSIVQLDGAIIGRIDTSIIDSSAKTAVIVQEIGRAAPVDSSGCFIIRNLPVWEYHISIVRNNAIVALPGDTIPVSVSSGNTTSIDNLGSRTGMTFIDYAMTLNADGRAGAISFNVVNDVLIGGGVIGNDAFLVAGTGYDTSNIWNERSIPVFSFTTSTPGRKWFGWYSWSGTIAAGYFTEYTSLEIRRPWVAAIDSSDIAIELPDTSHTLNGYYRININGDKGLLLFSEADSRVTGSGDLIETMTGYRMYQSFRCSLLVVDEVARLNQPPLILEISFVRSDIQQQFYGWQSSDGNLIAGYYKDSSISPAVEFPWFATRTSTPTLTMQFKEITVNTDSGIGGGVAFLEEDSSLSLRLLIGSKDYYYQLELTFSRYKTTAETDSAFIHIVTDDIAQLSAIQGGDTVFLRYDIADDISHLSYIVSEDTTRLSGDIVIAGVPERPAYDNVKIKGSFTADIRPKKEAQWDCDFGDTISNCRFLY
ncbi:MAG: hypothetical protein JW913_17505 [Chitinispirillaceae bacterium]|nr:hypothetical protein [Chitinispirillaceae bacterium]